jgi:hypothetical protein
MASYYDAGSQAGGDMTYTQAANNLEKEQQDLDAIDNVMKQTLTKSFVKGSKV